MKRLLLALRQKLLHPLLRSRHPPEYTARGVLIGLTIALTPTVGIQMPAVLAVWLFVRHVARRWDFNLVVALAWCWVTNIATAPPLYYLYIVTGRILLGHWDEFQGYDRFSERLAAALPRDAGWLESAWISLQSLFENFGVPLFVGCLPWTVLGAWAGYAWSLRLLQRIGEIRAERRARRQRRG
jgi:uncharacterized protein (DUF2062 family)